MVSKRCEKEVRFNNINEIEREHILKRILHFKGNKKRTAEAPGIKRSTLYHRLKDYNIDI